MILSAYPKRRAGKWIARDIAVSIGLTVRSRRRRVIGKVEGASGIRRLEEVVVEESLLAAELDQVRAFGNHQLGRITIKSVREGSVQTALIEQIGRSR